MSIDISNLEVDVDAIECVQETHIQILAVAINQLVDARDVERLMALRLKLVEELCNEAAEMDIPDVRVRRIRGEQFKLDARMSTMTDEEAVKHIQNNFWLGAQFTAKDWNGNG